jgi:glycosyltransferase involved in cell wall biosynthesis
MRKPEPAKSPGNLPTFRIVTPSYNQGVYIEATIESVLAQNYPCLSYFVADGGSKDNTVEILQRRLRPNQWRSRKDKGQVDCLIDSFALGDEEILGFVNSDDLLCPGALLSAAKLFQADPELAVVYGGGVVVNSAGQIQYCKTVQPMDPAQLEEFCWIMQPATFFRRSWYQKVGGLDLRLSKAFDYDFWVKLVKAGAKCRPVDELYAVFRLHDTSFTVSQWKDFLPEELAVQWRYGDRTQFARRYAAARVRLCLEGKLSTIEADAFLGKRLDTLLGPDPWRETLGPMPGYFAALSCFARAGYKATRWYKAPFLALQLLTHPASIPGFFSLLSHGSKTGFWAMSRRRHAFQNHQRRRSREARTRVPNLPRLMIPPPG